MSSAPLLASRSDLNSLNAGAIHDDHDADKIQHVWPLSVRILHALLYGHRHKSNNKPGVFRCVWVILWFGVAGWFIFCGASQILSVAGVLPLGVDVTGWDHKAITIWKSAVLGQGVSNLLVVTEVLVNVQFSVKFFKQQVSAVLSTFAAFTDGPYLYQYSIWRRQWCGQ
jgi:hypothetical protein